MASPTTLQLEWNVVPRGEVLIERLERHTTTLPPVDQERDYVALAGLSREQQERRLLELAETGQTVAAIQIARRLYAYDLSQARAFIDILRGRST